MAREISHKLMFNCDWLTGAAFGLILTRAPAQSPLAFHPCDRIAMMSPSDTRATGDWDVVSDAHDGNEDAISQLEKRIGFVARS